MAKAKKTTSARARGRNRGPRGQPDLEAIGLVLLALGIFLAGVLVPALPTGQLGRNVRLFLVGRVGWGAYVAPLPLLVIGGLFLLRRNPGWWPRALAGYVVLAVGLWATLMIVWPGHAGGYGVRLRATLTGAWGTLTVVPALFVASLGLELLLSLPPTRIARNLLLAIVQAVRTMGRGLLDARRRARARAAFSADVAQVRRALGELDRDLAALSDLYPGSGLLEGWRADVRATHARLAGADLAALDDVRGQLKAWQNAVRDFTKDRAREKAMQLKAEAVRPPDDSDTFEAWARALKPELDQSAGEEGPAALALDRLRKALALDLTGLLERQRRLHRERDLEERALARMSPRELARAQHARERRLEAIASLEHDAAALHRDAGRLEPWRDLVRFLQRLRVSHPDYAEIGEVEAALAGELEGSGRAALAGLEGWETALEGLAERAEVAALEARSARRAAARLEADLEASATAAAPTRGGARVGAEPPATAGRHGGSGNAPDDAAEPAPRGDDVPVVGAAGVAAPRLDDVPPWEELPAGDPFAAFGAAEAAAERYAANPPVPSTRGDAELAAALLDEGVVPQPVPDQVAERVAAVGVRPSGRLPGEDGADTEARPVPPEFGGIPIQVPPLTLLDEPEAPVEDKVELAREHRDRVKKIDETLASFKLEGRVVAAVRGPTVTRFEVEPAPGEKISRFANLSDDLALAMAVGSVRIEAPIPGKSVIGLEVPNANRELVRFREAAEAASFRRAKARLPIILGKSIDGEMVVGDLAKMPHLLIAGSTGSGKSVAVNTLIGSLLYRFLPTELRLLMIDPKMVELTPFDGVPHLLRPVVTNPSDAAGVLLGAVAHMERRYKMMSKLGSKNLDQYNEKARNLDMPELPFIAIVIDELADLMITSPKEVESAIMRLAQMARATGMHLILATQRPSVDILTSLIKVNVPARVAFAVSSSHDSRTILDSMGAERLIGMGDMLFYQPGLVKAVRLQGPFISEGEITSLSDFLRRQYFDDDFVEAYGADFDPPSSFESDASGLIDWNDDKLRAAAELVVNEGQASVSRLQRRLSVGHARAGKLMDSLEALGVVGGHQGSKPREVLVAFEELPDIFGK